MDATTLAAERRYARIAGRPERCDRIALVLQGGGALQALHEAAIEPDWVSGVSIGAINSAIIASNPEFSATSMREHWQSGYVDTKRALKHRQWLDMPGDGGSILVHDVHRQDD